MTGWLAADVLRQISDGEVDGIRRLVPKQRQLCFVRRYNNWYYRGARMFKLNSFLEDSREPKSIDLKNAWKYLSGPPPLSGMHVAITAKGLVGVRIVALRGEDKMRCEFGVAIQRANTFKHIPKIYVKCLSGDNDLLPFEFWAAG